jgi:DASS family divalent anion:Na+ symporter
MVEDIRKIDFFADLDRKTLAKIIPYFNRKSFASNEQVFTESLPSKYFYYLQSGRINLHQKDRQITTTANNFFGWESALDVSHYISNARADSDVVVWEIDRQALKVIFGSNPHKQKQFYQLLFNNFVGKDFPLVEATNSERGVHIKGNELSKAIGWLLAIVLPMAIGFWSIKAGFEWNAYIFLMVLSATIVMWIFGLVAEFIPGIFAILSLLILGVAPSSTILSGFASGSFFMAMSLFGLGSIIAKSGIIYRLVLIVSKYLPNSVFWHSLSILINGIILNPIIPSANGRVGLINVLLVDTIESLGLRYRGKAATHLAVSAFMGISLVAYVFLSSKSANFIVYGLLPEQVKQQFSWGYWLLAGSVAGVVSIALYLILAFCLFRDRELPQVSKDKINVQLEILGELTNLEWLAAIGILLFLVGTMTSSIHKIELPWIGLGILYLFLALGLMEKQQFQSQIDWSFLILLGSLVGVGETMSYVGIDFWIGQNLFWLVDYMKTNFYLFVFLLMITILLVRFFLPNNATVAIFATILIPLAENNGINPWIIGLLLLNFSDAWLLPYQCSYYLQFREDNRDIYNEKLMLKANFWTNVIRVFAIYLSLPYWQYLGLL